MDQTFDRIKNRLDFAGVNENAERFPIERAFVNKHRGQYINYSSRNSSINLTEDSWSNFFKNFLNVSSQDYSCCSSKQFGFFNFSQLCGSSSRVTYFRTCSNFIRCRFGSSFWNAFRIEKQEEKKTVKFLKIFQTRILEKFIAETMVEPLEKLMKGWELVLKKSKIIYGGISDGITEVFCGNS